MNHDRIHDLIREIDIAIRLADNFAPPLSPGREIFGAIRGAFLQMRDSLLQTPETCDLDFIEEAIEVFRGKIGATPSRKLTTEEILFQLTEELDLVPEAF